MEQTQTPELVNDLHIRDLVINGLAMTVPEFLSRAQAVEQLVGWYPQDELALTALHRRISANY